MAPIDSEDPKGDRPVQRDLWGNIMPEPFTYPTADGGSITTTELQNA